MDDAKLSQIEFKLGKRGFRPGDGILHKCDACGTLAVRRYVLAGRTGGRDITLCTACDVSQSWRSGVGLEERVLDTDFDLAKFLG